MLQRTKRRLGNFLLMLTAVGVVGLSTSGCVPLPSVDTNAIQTPSDTNRSSDAGQNTAVSNNGTSASGTTPDQAVVKNNKSDTLVDDTIPGTVKVSSFLPGDEAIPPQSTYTVVVTDVPVREVLFALARDANLNVDILSDITGQVTLNAIDQTLPRILDRIARQANIWYRIEEGNIVVGPDIPVRRNYRVDYVSSVRNVKSDVHISTTVASSDQSGQGITNSSTVNLGTSSAMDFWKNLITNIRGIVGAEVDPNNKDAGDSNASRVIWNEATGIISVMGTSHQHKEVREFIDRVVNSARRQVLIEATVAEVQLSDQYQGGIDWSLVNRRNGAEDTGNHLSFMANKLTATPRASISLKDMPFLSWLMKDRDISATVRMLSQFGNTRVLSSPRITVLSNQTAILRVTTNEVYFQIKVTPPRYEDNKLVMAAIAETQIRTVPIGFIMQVTPQIGETDTITLNIRPTIQRISKWVDNPDPNLRANLGNIQNYVPPQVPVVQVQEMDSVLRVPNGQVAVMGGLMENSRGQTTDGVPILARMPIIGHLFSFRTQRATKTELVIFLRPVILDEPDKMLNDHERILLSDKEPLPGSWNPSPEIP
ncbi:MAG: type II and III secretion system protein [Magnetococcales bacterium]|nr:type II and III secretion system protein [Magnetococcales bacterium]